MCSIHERLKQVWGVNNNHHVSKRTLYRGSASLRAGPDRVGVNLFEPELQRRRARQQFVVMLRSVLELRVRHDAVFVLAPELSPGGSLRLPLNERLFVRKQRGLDSQALSVIMRPTQDIAPRRQVACGVTSALFPVSQ